MQKEALDGSVLIVAHPDDEILWFGSVGANVESIVICFLNDPATPDLKESRERVLRSHPWTDRITCLGLDETGAFGFAGWPVPEPTNFGLSIVKKENIAADYELKFAQVRELLTPIVRAATSVITHNPWGEYGHEEHVLVCRAATDLAEAHSKPVWYSNYASTWSEELMRRYLDKANRPVTRGVVPVEQMQDIASLYRRHGAWTWFDDYDWFPEEFYARGPLILNDDPSFGTLFPVNLIRLPERQLRAATRPDSTVRRILRQILRY
jgi:LmbE family N-acetylglucosaminyl deacetylase